MLSHVEQESFIQPQLPHPALHGNNIPATTIISITLTKSLPAWMSLKQTILAKADFTPVRFYQQNIGNLSASSPENNLAVDVFTQNERYISFFSLYPCLRT